MVVILGSAEVLVLCITGTGPYSIPEVKMYELAQYQMELMCSLLMAHLLLILT